MRWCLATQEALLRAPWPEAILSEPQAAEEWGPKALLHRGLRGAHGRARGRPRVPRGPTHGPCGLFRPHGERGGARGGGRPRRAGAAHGRGLGPRGGPPRAAGPPLRAPAGGVPPQGHRPARLAGADVARLAGGSALPGPARPARSGAATSPWTRASSSAARRSWRRCGRGSRGARGSSPSWARAGMGKTRLATHYGSLQMDARIWAGGVWLCDLTEATGLDDFCHAVGEALGVALSEGGEAHRSGGAARPRAGGPRGGARHPRQPGAPGAARGGDPRAGGSGWRPTPPSSSPPARRCACPPSAPWTSRRWGCRPRARRPWRPSPARRRCASSCSAHGRCGAASADGRAGAAGGGHRPPAGRHRPGD